jgi:hypothetical protein
MMNSLTDRELKALRRMRTFQLALEQVEREEAADAARIAAAREARRNPDGTWKHDHPSANPNREDGLYGKAAAAADGDWYGSH